MSGTEFLFYMYLAAFVGMVWGLHLTACYESERSIFNLYNQDYLAACDGLASFSTISESEKLYWASRNREAK